jgi:uncharacterized ferredoxin-like protein
MSCVNSQQSEKDAIKMAAALMAASARTAPKARGVDDVKSLILDGNDLEALADAMERKADEKPPYLSTAYIRDAAHLRDSGCVLLIGVTGNPKEIERPIDCGACGYASCEQLAKARKQTKDFDGPNCILQIMDLGIALGSAAKLASELNMDNRIMYTIGAAAKKMGLLDSDVIIGIPLSATGKSPYFDRD